MDQDIRWIQRLNNYEKAFKNLSKAVELATERDLSDLEKQGLIQSFEFTFELAWNVIKDFFEYQGETSIFGSKDAFSMAFRRGLITKGEYMMESIKSRQLTSHTYHEETANKIYHNIIDKYHEAYEELLIVLKRESGKI